MNSDCFLTRYRLAITLVNKFMILGQKVWEKIAMHTLITYHCRLWTYDQTLLFEYSYVFLLQTIIQC